MKYYFSKKLDGLQAQAIKKIKAIAQEKAITKSDFKDYNVLKITNEFHQFRLGGGWLVEVSENNLISNNSNEYDFNCITIEQLCSLTDYLSNKYTPKVKSNNQYIKHN